MQKNSEPKPLNILDLVPTEAKFKLGTRPDEEFTLCRWSLRVRAWAVGRWGHEGLKDVFQKQMIQEIAGLAWFMLLEKEKFEGIDGFLDCISSTQDSINVIQAINKTVGIGEPEVKQMMAFAEKKTQGKMKPPLQPSQPKRTTAK
jgi:hypothetical protein